MLEFDAKEAVEQLRTADRKLARVIDAAGPCGMKPDRRRTPFQALVRAIVYQQLSGKVAAKIHARLLERLPRPSADQAQTLLKLSEEELRSAGVSRAKAAALKDLAQRTRAGEVPSRAQMRRMDNEEIIERLVLIRGVGRWTAEMLLMFSLGRPDVLPVTDFGVRKGFMLTFGTAELPGAKEIQARGARWRPYRSVASWYLWRAVDLTNAAAGKDGGGVPW